MRSLFSLICFIFFSLSATAGQLEGILPLAKDDAAAIAQVRTTPEKHVVLYFGDHVN